MTSPYTLKAKRYKTDLRPFLEVVMGDNGHLVLRVRQATEKGYIECDPNGVADLAYPNSELRRARVKERGSIAGTITAAGGAICVPRRRRTTKLDTMKKLILPIDVMMTVPITDIRHTLEEINRHRLVHAQMEEQNKLRAQRCYKYYGRYKKAK